MKHRFAFILLSLLPPFIFAQKINLLYDTQSDGTIYPNSIWIVNMINEAGKKHNIEVNFEGAPWSRALQLVQSGIADGVINASYKQSRAQFAVYPLKNGKPDTSKSLKAPAYYFYKRKEHPLNFDGEKISNNNGLIGAIKSYAVVDNLKLLKANIAFGINSASNLNNVLHNRFIATAELEDEANTIIQNNKSMKEALVKIDIPIRKKEYYLIISKSFYKQYPQIANTLWNEIKQLKNTKKYIKARSSKFK